MKSQYLTTLAQAGFPVPPFAVFDRAEAVDPSFSRADRFAVRSDFSGEDGTDRSFAGQFLTELDVPREDLPAAAARVLASARAPGVRAYSPQRGQMGVIIQEMVAADHAGVLFTANPQGLLSEMVVVLGAGLGPGVVEDQVPTTTCYFSTHDGLYYTETQAGGPALSPTLLETLTKLGAGVRALFVREMDLEFALSGGRVYLLQARPITTLDPAAPSIVLYSSNIAESYPGVSLPATQSFAQAVYTRVFERCVLRVTGDPSLTRALGPTLGHMVDVSSGRIYYRISSWYDIIRLLPFSKKITAVWQEMLGVDEKTVVTGPCPPVRPWTRARIALGFLRALAAVPGEMDRLGTFFHRELPHYRAALDACRDLPALLALYDRLLDELGDRWDVTLINDMYAFLFTALARQRHAGRVDQVCRLESMGPVRALEALSRLAATEGRDSGAYQAARAAYLDQYGDRAPEELKLETRTPRLDPTLLDAYLSTPSGADLAPPEGAEERDPWSVRCAKRGIRNRERSRLDRCRIFGVVRDLLLRAGALLVRAGVLAEDTDVFWLELAELRALAAVPRPSQALVAERKALYEGFRALPAYSRLVFLGQVFDKAPQGVTGQGAQDEGGVLRGVPCSGGVAEGEVLLVTQADLSLDTRGKILVTRTTDPGWVFLIKPAAAILSEQGSLLSHTSIIARELKKPAVVAVPNVTRRLRNGDRVRVDGTAGTVTRWEDC